MPKQNKTVPVLVVNFLSSYGLAAVLFVLLAILVLFGTLAQINIGIHDVKRDYFSSAFVIHRFFFEDSSGLMQPSRFGIPLIGGYPLMALLFVNILLGGLIRIRKRPQTIGVVISHFSMLILLAWGFVTNHFVNEGYVRIFEGEKEGSFTDYTIWDMEVVKETGDGARETAFIIPHEDLTVLAGDSQRLFRNANWPFEVKVSGYERNCDVQFDRSSAADERSVEGYYLRPLSLEMRAEANLPGAYVTVSAEGEELGNAVLASHARHPFTFTANGDTWSLVYTRRTYDLPYEVKLREFIKVDHPGISMAKRYMSDVTRISGDNEDEVRIRMNHPMTAGQYTFYQADFGPKAEDPPNTPPYTVLAVWKRPLKAGYWPLISCITVAAGLLIHFIMKLVQYFSRRSSPGSAISKAEVPVDEGFSDEVDAIAEATEDVGVIATAVKAAESISKKKL